MLTGLTVGNFKAFSDTQSIKIKPITLIFGANSAGKSSIIHSLLLSAHASSFSDSAGEASGFDVHKMAIGGDSVDLGGFRQYVYKGDSSSQVELGLSIDAAQLGTNFKDILWGYKTISVITRIGIKKKELPPVEPNPEGLFEMDKDLLDEMLDMNGPEPEVLGFEILIDKEPLLRMSIRKGGVFRIDTLNLKHDFSRRFNEALLLSNSTTEKISPADMQGVNDEIGKLLNELYVQFDHLFPTLVAIAEDQKKTSESSAAKPQRGIDSLFPISQENRAKDLRETVRRYFPRYLTDFFVNLNSQLTSALDNIIYLGPLRSYPPRHLAFSAEGGANWKAGGGIYWEIIKRDENVRSLVNQWLSDKKKLKTPYTFKLRRLISTDQAQKKLSEAFFLMSDVRADLKNKNGDDYIKDDHDEDDDQDHDLESAGLERYVKGDPEMLADAAGASLEEIKGLLEPVLIDNRSKTEVSHRDVGIGISQVLPVLVAAFSSKGKILAMEQPEIHLHPALQAELGDVFIQAALSGNKNTFILETHSEHLVLRIMRRIRETHEGKPLPQGVPAIKPEDVSILYVEPDGSRSIVREMELNERGEFVKAWPGGFFEEGLRELMP